MPISALLPTIDDRRYDDIVAEARARIPRYTPEWTDHNDNDPGITVVQLFAWLTDMLLYRLGQVPQLNYLKFIELLGMELAAAEPATAEITLPVSATAGVAVVTVPMGTQLSATIPGVPAPVVFETDRSLVAVAATLEAVQVFHDDRFDDVSDTNTAAAPDSNGFLPFGPSPGLDAALYLGFSAAQPFPAVELDLAFIVPDAVARVSVACGSRPSALIASSRIEWEYLDGMTWRPLRVLKDETQSFLRSGHIVLRTPGPSRMTAFQIGQVADSKYWIRGRLAKPAYERAPTLLAVRTNTVSATQMETIQGEVLGGSNGQPNQVLTLANTPVLAGSLVLSIDEGIGADTTPWAEVEDLFASGPRDRHYTLDRTTGEIRFGDGTHGAIPVGNPSNSNASIVALEYKVGGGTQGNVKAGAISTLMSSVPGIDDAAVANLLAAAGGRDEETLADARLRVPHAIRTRGRAVTATDFEELATQAANVKRAFAIPRAHPGFPGVEVPGAVTVIVVPDMDTPNPTPSEGTLRAVCQCLDQARLLTVEVYVAPPTYQLVSVTADVVANDDADTAAVQKAIEEALVTYFHPLRGGEDGTGWPFGADVYFSRVFQRMSVAGVQRIDRVTITLDGKDVPDCTNATVCPNALVYSVEHAIHVTYSTGA